ncbi:MAG TPA: GFA family protein, partial [Rhizomicrobium sp.]|nr:GFA family protein [Rhizomicrobium sp.]
RRTGAPFGVGAYYAKDKVRISGASKLYTRQAASGHPFHLHFCPTCGTSLYWYSAYKPDTIGIAVGGFADPQFPVPVRSVWEQTRHGWVELPDGVQHFAQGRNSGPQK